MFPNISSMLQIYCLASKLYWKSLFNSGSQPLNPFQGHPISVFWGRMLLMCVTEPELNSLEPDLGCLQADWESTFLKLSCQTPTDMKPPWNNQVWKIARLERSKVLISRYLWTLTCLAALLTLTFSYFICLWLKSVMRTTPFITWFLSAQIIFKYVKFHLDTVVWWWRKLYTCFVWGRMIWTCSPMIYIKSTSLKQEFRSALCAFDS